MERSALGDDILTCPNCLSDSGLVIGWFPISESDSKKFTRVGCKKYKIYFSENEHWHAVIFWNNFAITEFAKKKKIHKHSELYKSLYLKAKLEKKVNELQQKIDQYLEEKISVNCKFSVGDIFKDKRDKSSNWMVKKVNSFYGCNTGPFWIIKAQYVNKNGKLTDGEKEFWERDQQYFIKGKIYWKPTRWSQIKPNKQCLYKGSVGNVNSVSYSKREAIIQDGSEFKKISTLMEIKVSVIEINEI
ncbi:MAG: hypothetical protein K8S13_20380 [Desulfobacula sp.]|uniref:hypothetical protein n=1 Tax=Desulfobacula sp. TaxID=2593537 RepID=UPI0025C30B31|nr:hypothetical protein [Desulfobacula sp.]MCD4722194.1 hypothetical protein [Desulfobacula sp.]